MPAFCPYFDGGNVSAQGPGIKSVSGDDSSLKILELEPTSLRESVSTSESHAYCCTGAAEVVDAP